MFAGAQKDTDFMDRIARVFFRPIAEGYLPSRYRALLAGGRLVALSKFPKTGIRPIVVGNAWRRLVAKGLMQMCHKSVHNFFQHRHPRALQFGGSTKNGATNMFHFLASMVESVPRGVPAGGTLVDDPLTVLALDCTNAFNTLSKQGLFKFLQEGCEKHGGVPDSSQENGPVGWDILWSYIDAHYGVKGVLKYYHAGKVHDFSSEAGVHQGDPIASTLFALALHPLIIEVAEAHNVIITAYADNIIMTGKLSVVREAAVMCRDLMAMMNLKLNPSESEAYIPQWYCVPPQTLADSYSGLVVRGASMSTWQLRLSDNTDVQLQQEGIKVLGCALGSDTFCEKIIRKTAEKIEQDLECLDAFPYVHQHFNLATQCSNTLITYFLRATKLQVSSPVVAKLDQSFKAFYARVLCFEKDYATGKYAAQYQHALQQILLRIRNSCFGVVS